MKGTGCTEQSRVANHQGWLNLCPVFCSWLWSVTLSPFICFVLHALWCFWNWKAVSSFYRMTSCVDLTCTSIINNNLSFIISLVSTWVFSSENHSFILFAHFWVWIFVFFFGFGEIRVRLFATLWPIHTVHGLLQPMILEWVAFPFSRGSFQTRDRTQVFCIAGGFLASWATREA